MAVPIGKPKRKIKIVPVPEKVPSTPIQPAVPVPQKEPVPA